MRTIVLFCFLILYFLNVNSQESRKTIAVQALFNSEDILDSIRIKAAIYDNISSAQSLGARPHMTIASFNLTEDEVVEITNSFQLLNNNYSSHSFSVQIMIETEDSAKWSYYLVPTVKDEKLIVIHDSLYITIDKGYIKQRKIDMPGNWWPHISLFAVHASTPKLSNNIQTELDKIKQVTIGGFSLVSFGPINYFSEIKTIN